MNTTYARHPKGAQRAQAILRFRGYLLRLKSSIQRKSRRIDEAVYASFTIRRLHVTHEVHDLKRQ